MKTTIALIAMFAATPAIAETASEPYEVKVDPPVCYLTIVKKVFYAGPPEGQGLSRCGACASGIAYTNGEHQDGSYSFVPEMEHSRPGDRIQLCLVSILANCPKGDDRNKTYKATNLRTHESWVRPNYEHMCGGA